MKILSIDQATRKSGVCVLNSDTKEIFYSGLIEEKDKDYVKRIYSIKNRVFDIFDKFNCEVISFEGTTYQNNAQALIMLAHLQGMFLDECMKRDLLYVIPKASEWRSVLGFIHKPKGVSGTNRDYQKQQAIDYCLKTYNMNLSNNDDEAEAIAQANAVAIKYFSKK